MLHILNVAEKPSVARKVASTLSQYMNSESNQVKSYSKYNPVIQFFGQYESLPCKMLVTSVSGHILELDVDPELKKWNLHTCAQLFRVPLRKNVKPESTSICKNLQLHILSCSLLILWLDCDREGENIAFEVIDICSEANPNIRVQRARFSALSDQSIFRAWNHLTQPDKYQSAAADCRQELDLRIGAAFTRFLTLKYRDKYSTSASIISFGPCQIPTLGFVVERYLQNKDFIAEKCWTLQLVCSIHDQTNKETKILFSWSRKYIFDSNHSWLHSSFQAEVKEITKQKPLPLTTVELMILASSKLKISSKQCMTIAENLYQKGIISYPRTETNYFDDEIYVQDMLRLHVNHPDWGGYVNKMLIDGFEPTRRGLQNDNAHPPIHPVKSMTRIELTSHNDWLIYDLICRHFFACNSKNAAGEKAEAIIELAEETFYASGMRIKKLGFIEIYGQYLEWEQTNEVLFNKITVNDLNIFVNEIMTKSPSLLTESALIKLMDQNQIGTDATMQEHIKTILDRNYVELVKGKFIPTNLGLALVIGFQGYADLWLDLSKPKLRSQMEKDISLIASKKHNKNYVLSLYVQKMEQTFNQIYYKSESLDQAFSKFLCHV